MRKVMNVLVVAMLAVPAVVLGQGDDVAKVLADMKAALGGADKIAAVRTMTAIGRTLRTNPSGTTSESEFELAMELPDKYMMRSVLASMGNMSVYRNAGFNGDGVINQIDQPPSLGGGGGQIMVRAMGPGGGGPGQQTTPEQREAANRAMLMNNKKDFARLALGLLGSSYDAFPLEFAYVGEAEAADGKAYVIDVKGADEFTGRLFVDTKTNLPLMFSWMALEPLVITQNARGGGPGGGQTIQMGGGGSFTSAGGAQGGGRQLSDEERKKMMADMEEARRQAEANRKMVEFRVYYSNYKTVNGVKLPHTLQRSVDGKPVEETTFESFRINPKIDAKKFEVTK